MAASTESFTLTGSTYVDISEGAARIETIVPFIRNSGTGVRFHIGQSLPASDTVNYQLVNPGNTQVRPDEIQRDIPVEFRDLAGTDRVYARVNTSTNIVTLQVHRFDGDAGSRSGIYTPTVTAVTNLDSAAASGPFHYYQVGNLVQVWGTLVLDPTATAQCEVDISLPIVSGFSASNEANGSISNTAGTQAGRVQADETNDRLAAFFTATATSSSTFAFSASYRVF